MIGAIAGDIIGSLYEALNIRTTEFPLFDHYSHFTDDTVLTVALADCILNGDDYVELLKHYGRRYPNAGYGETFFQWVHSPQTEPYYSWGNGSAMRVSPVGFAYDTLEEVLEQAKRSAEVTHNHPEGIKGAQAVAAAIFLARTGADKPAIKAFIEETFGYSMDSPIATLRTTYRFDISCQGSVPQALTAFLESSDYEDAVRKAISIGGDSDTIACMAGGVAQAYYGGVPEAIQAEVYARLDEPLAEIVREFTETYACG